MKEIISFGVLVVVFLTVIYGWVLNIIQLINGSYESISTIIVGAVGIFMMPVGALVYYVAG